MIRILQGDCRSVLRDLPDCSVQCVVTSPPYYGLRDYNVSGQIGLEQSPAEYVEQMVAVFREMRRVLRDDGTCWLNLGDSYCSGCRTTYSSDDKLPQRASKMRPGNPQKNGGNSNRDGVFASGIKPKDLIGVPWRVAFALQADGWHLRRDIIWHKPNPMPESVTDRPTTSHEYLFLLTKSARYFYDADAIREEGVIPAGTLGAKGSAERAAQLGVNSRPPEYKVYDGTRNARSVWTIATHPFSEAHFATFPPELAERCIKAGTSEKGCCPQCGAGWERVVETPPWEDAPRRKSAKNPHLKNCSAGHAYQLWRNKNPPRTVGWRQSCSCPPHDSVPCAVLDPFGGAGTTGLIADRLGRNATLIELNADYIDIARRRISGDCPMFAEVA